MIGIIYILVNEFMPNLVKIGITERSVEQRIKELDNTNTPVPFQCVFAAEVNDIVNVEKLIHTTFEDKRIRKNREFFRVSPHQVEAAIKLSQIREVTPKEDVVNELSDKEALKKYGNLEEGGNKWRFKDLRIPVNSILYFSKNNSITSIVEDANSNRIIFDGKKMSLSAAALKVLKNIGYNWSSARGSDYWVYEGKTLTARGLELV